MTQPRKIIAAGLFSLALIAAVLAAPQGKTLNDQAGENACLDAYNNCYNNCNGKPDVCYSNCDVVYRHCMHGTGVDFPAIKKHPGKPPRTLLAKSKTTPTPKPKGKPTPTPSPKPTDEATRHSKVH